MLGDESLVILDCNKPDIYQSSHIPGSIGIGLHAFSDKVGKPGDAGWGTIKSKEDLESVLTSLGIDDTKTVVLYSDVFKGPGADGRAAWQLNLAGFENAKILMGGSSYWKELGYEMTNDETPTPLASSGVTLKDYDQNFIATKDELYNSLGKKVVLDVRTKKEFDGSQNAGEPRGGHIVGAGHILWTDFLESNGTLKSPEAIEEIMNSFDVAKTDDLTLY
jgi:thiosulfate/3-mercaptopyruvate sulfurtransferase